MTIQEIEINVEYISRHYAKHGMITTGQAGLLLEYLLFVLAKLKKKTANE